MIARTTGGKAFTAQSSGAVAKIYQSLGSSLGRRRKLEEITSWFAAAAALLLLGSLGAAKLTGERLP